MELHHLHSSCPGITLLVLSPTRELAAQTHRALTRLVAGTNLKATHLDARTAHGTDFSRVDFLVATPLPLVRMLDSKKVTLHCPPVYALVQYELTASEALDR